jgi:hypothetical protein
VQSNLQCCGYIGRVAATRSLGKLISNIAPSRLFSAIARQMLDKIAHVRKRRER